MNILTLIAGSKGETLGRFKGYGGNRNPPRVFATFVPTKVGKDFNIQNIVVFGDFQRTAFLKEKALAFSKCLP